LRNAWHERQQQRREERQAERPVKRPVKRLEERMLEPLAGRTGGRGRMDRPQGGKALETHGRLPTPVQTGSGSTGVFSAGTPWRCRHPGLVVRAS
jgi:hypothetical protein